MSKVNGTHHLNEKEKPEIIYVFDALCGWCYGFTPVIKKIRDQYTSSTDFLVLSGGMITEKDAGPISVLAEFIKGAYRTVENTCGVKFGEKFLKETLEKGDAHFSSDPPARALAVFRTEQNHKALEFASKIQSGIYYEGVASDDLNYYGKIAAEFGIDPQSFIARLNTPETSEIISNEFRMVRSMGVTSFPSVVIRKGKELQVVSRGYKEYVTLQTLVDKYINEL